jgi:hypothetical protein
MESVITISITKPELFTLIKDLVNDNSVRKYLVSKGFCKLEISKRKFLGFDIIWLDEYVLDLSIDKIYTIFQDCKEIIYG